MSINNEKNNNVKSYNLEDAGKNPLEGQMEEVLQLMTRRARGEATNDQVQEAVSDILSRMGAPASFPSKDDDDDNKKAPVSNKKSNSNKRKKEKNSTSSISPPLESESIRADTGNYDDDNEDEEDCDKQDTTPKAKQFNIGHRRKKQKKQEQQKSEEAYQEELSLIPMGKEGAKMMTTFGDGPQPLPETLRAALLGCRQSLQVAVRDARAIRRSSKAMFEQAKKQKRAQEGDFGMMYRAQTLSSGQHDRLSMQPKCGFDIEQLTLLFPEEMHAYQRWNEMHREYRDKEKDEEDETTEPASPNKGGRTMSNSSTAESSKQDNGGDDGENGGHLQERAAHFDARTQQMKSDWYTTVFAKVRQGSFLPRGNRSRGSSESQWDTQRKGEGRAKTGSWEALPATSVKFLHWLGFEPPTFPPPNQETTNGLGFLGYDIMGRIIEKAIYLRKSKERQLATESTDDDEENMEVLKPGEQLTPYDIEQALLDPNIRPAPLHSISDEEVEDSLDPKNCTSFQLYFGPGFEQRLELEMEAYV